MPRHTRAPAHACEWCGEPGWHGTTDGCLTALHAGVWAEQVRLVTAIATAQRLQAMKRRKVPPTVAVCPTCGAWHPIGPDGKLPWSDRTKG